jgi:hypothetical protein
VLLSVVDQAGNKVAAPEVAGVDCGGCSPTVYECSASRPECCDAFCLGPSFCDGTQLAVSAPGYYVNYLTIHVPGSTTCGLLPDPLKLTVVLTADH